MPGLHLHTSNRLENLFADLAGILARPLSDILQPETIVVQSVGMGRWLSWRLAEAQGISANVRFPFPQKFVAEIFAEALPEAAAGDLFTRELLPWRIMRLLPALIRRDEFRSVCHYLDGERPELKLYQLSNKIAEVIDRYLAFRPRMILEWDAGKGKDWQAILWRELAQGNSHPPMLAMQLAKKLRAGGELGHLPERIAIFGISTLPGFYLDIIQGIARKIEVHLFVLKPTAEWWGDTYSERQEMHARRQAKPSSQLDLQFARGNPLLASLGKLGQDFLKAITDLEPTKEHESFELPAGETMLAQIQRDIFLLHDPGAEPPRAVSPDDRSLQFHSCHSAMREMEVLHDQLLALFEQQPDLKPHEIVVMAPDIKVYAPYIEAVFDTAPEKLRLPFSIADRGARAESGIIDTFLRILESAGSRFTASSVVNILESGALQRHFGLVDSDLEIVRSWIEETGIRWGIDAAQRAALGLPAFAENSWRAGLDRLLLGYAAPARGERLFEGILAYDQVEGTLAETLGRFVEFCEALFATAGELQHPRSLLDWQETLRQITARFFSADDEREAELRQVRRVIESLGETATLSGFDEAVPLDVLLAHLEQALARSERGSGFLVGKVTFCALKPMRTVPFRVVCLVGMNDTAYPRHDRPPGFDLIAQDSQPGDRSTRDDDRYLFLEALLSARDHLYFSYIGQSIRDNSPLPPSVFVSELLDYAQASFSPATTLVRQERLQPFSREYFQPDGQLFSYSEENCAASAAATGERREPSAFILQPLSEPEEEWRQLDIAQLISFFGNPAKFLLEKRLDLRLPKLKGLLEENEPVEIDSLAKYQLQQDLLTRALRDEPLALLLPVLRANGELPPGHAGDARLRQMIEAAGEFSALVRQHLAAGLDEPRDVQLRLDDFAFGARLDKLSGGRLVHYRLTTRKPKDLLIAWFYHLSANAARPTESVLITADKESRPVLESFPSIDAEKATEHLRKLLVFYWRGLRKPLHFFPRSSLAFVEQTLQPSGQLSPLEKAQAKWRKSPERWAPDFGERPEADDPHFNLVFRHVTDPLDDNFQELALAVFAPILKGLRR